MSTKRCVHEWEVFSTALVDGCLLVQCKKCDKSGTINDPSQEEWNKAFFAPSNPYDWTDTQRVSVR